VVAARGHWVVYAARATRAGLQSADRGRLALMATARDVDNQRDLDMERVFFRLHVKLIGMVTRHFDIGSLRFWEGVALVQAIGCLALLVFLHSAFVNPGGQPSCTVLQLVAQMSAHHAAHGRDADVVQVRVGGIWSRLPSVDADTAAAKSRLLHHTHRGPSAAAGPEDELGTEPLVSGLLEAWLQDPMFLFSREKGFLLLSAKRRSALGLSQLNASLDFSCVPLPWARGDGEGKGDGDAAKSGGGGSSRSGSSTLLTYVLDNFVGYDTVVTNSFIHATDGRGFLYSVWSREQVDLAYVSQGMRAAAGTSAVPATAGPGTGAPGVVEVAAAAAAGTGVGLSAGAAGGAAAGAATTSTASGAGVARGGWASAALYKVGIVATTLFLLFITTTLVHHTLRETQGMMLQFTVDLQRRIEQQRPYHTLVVNHAVNSLVFVPVMVGMLFFLCEFFNDQLLAFMLLALVWVCELFSVITLRTRASIRTFPRLFSLYFCGFHLYFFSFPSGFSYLALTTTVAFLHHAMLLLWNRFEIPALRRGEVSARCPRQLVQPAAAGDDELGCGLPPSLAYRALLGTEPRVSVHEQEDSAAAAAGMVSPGPPAMTIAQQQQQQQQQEARQVPAMQPLFEGVAAEEGEASSSGDQDRPIARRKKRQTLHSSPTPAIGAAAEAATATVLEPVARRRFLPGGSSGRFEEEGVALSRVPRFGPGGSL
jgi:hypothetical protein